MKQHQFLPKKFAVIKILLKIMIFKIILIILILRLLT